MILIFNGPPASGKDESCLSLLHLGFTHLSFKTALFKETIFFYGVDEKWFFDGYTRESKETKEEALGGLSRREALIYVSEDIIKPKYGQGYFGEKLALQIKNKDDDICISDGGFVEEIYPLINKVGADNIAIVQLTRDGCTFSSDSRRYLSGTLVEEFVIDHKTEIPTEHVLVATLPIRTYRMHNNGSKIQFIKTLYKIYEKEQNEQRNKGPEA